MMNRIGYDAVGQRGEAIFYVALTRLYGRSNPLFRPQFLGDKWPTVDYIVELNHASSLALTPYFFVQVRATRRGYTQRNKRLKVKIGKAEVRKLAMLPAPTYIIGIDEIAETGYIIAANRSVDRGLTSISTAFPINQECQDWLWQEVTDFWTNVGQLNLNSRFTDSLWR
ncbi:MAG: hypothetical protein U0350_31440 [Caldilineaceae bacterium]